MSTVTTRTEHAPEIVERPRFVDLVRSEWIKFTSVPLMLFGLIALPVGGIAVSVFLGLILEQTGVPSVKNVEMTIGDHTIGMVVVGQIVAGILGVMCIGSEYSSGTIRSTLLSSPARVRVLLAKAVLMFGLLTGVGLVTSFGAWAAATPLYAPHGIAASLADPGVVGALVGAAAYLGFCGVLGLGLGAILRSTAAGAMAVFSIVMLIPILVFSVLTESVVTRLIRLIDFGHAGDSMARALAPGGPFLDLAGGHVSPAAAWIVVFAWSALALGIGASVLQRKDA